MKSDLETSTFLKILHFEIQNFDNDEKNDIFQFKPLSSIQWWRSTLQTLSNTNQLSPNLKNKKKKNQDKSMLWYQMEMNIRTDNYHNGTSHLVPKYTS